MSTMTITKNQTLYRAWQPRESSLSRRASASSDGSVSPSAQGGWTHDDGNDQAEAQEALDHHNSDSSSRHSCRRYSSGCDEPGRRSPCASQRSQRSHLEWRLLQKLGKLWIQPERQDRPERDHRHMDEQ